MHVIEVGRVCPTKAVSPGPNLPFVVTSAERRKTRSGTPGRSSNDGCIGTGAAIGSPPRSNAAIASLKSTVSGAGPRKERGGMRGVARCTQRSAAQRDVKPISAQRSGDVERQGSKVTNHGSHSSVGAIRRGNSPVPCCLATERLPSPHHGEITHHVAPNHGPDRSRDCLAVWRFG